MSIENEIASLLKEAKEKRQKAQRLQVLLEKYPDLESRYPGRSRSPHYSSASMNSQVDQVSVTHTCSCCPDPGVVVYFWKETEHGKIYSDPPRFDVGVYWGYDQPNTGWSAKLKEAGISEGAIAKVADHFREAAEEQLAEAQADLDRVLENIE